MSSDKPPKRNHPERVSPDEFRMPPMDPEDFEPKPEPWRPPKDHWDIPDDWWRPPDDWWRCLRRGPVSGRYRGEMTAPNSGEFELVLRVDIDPRHENSPVMERVSGDLFRKYQYSFRGNTYEWRSYRESWIVDEPSVNWQDCYVDIKGKVRYWEGAHPSTKIGIRIPWGSMQPAGPADVKFWESGSTTPDQYSCQRESAAFRDLRLEVDVCDSVNSPPILPEYDTHDHSTRPSGLPQRTLTIEEAYQEAGVDVTIPTGHTIIDDSASEFDTWSPAELHDAMESHFSQYSGGWPKWHMWGLLAGDYDRSTTAGIMFDARSAYGGAGEPPERQGFAVFRNHDWFDDLTTGTPANQDEAWAMRQFLYTWVHEAGHAFNFLHSWDKGRANSLSWMNYPHRVTDFWDDFELRFDDKELIHMRHGDRNSVIMGGDAWATGGHLEGIPDAALDRMSPMEGDPPVELLVRSNGYFDFLEPVEIELRLRNQMDSQSIDVDRRLNPEFGNVSVFIRSPDGTIKRYRPVVHQLGAEEPVTLGPTEEAVEGEDRYSESVFIGYGADGHYFDDPGEYKVRAAYQDQNDLFIVSDTHTLRVGAPQSREENRFAQAVFTDEVGLSLYFNGSRSPHLADGMAVLEDLAEEYTNSLIGVKAATAVAGSLKEPFYSVRDGTVTKLADADQSEALHWTEPAKELYHERDEAAFNLRYHDLIRTRAELLQSQGEQAQAREEVQMLREDLGNRGVNQPVLNTIEEFGDTL